MPLSIHYVLHVFVTELAELIIDYSFSLSMDQLPYEILQLVASWLLPRQQCRLAMVSQYCYRYLYNDLLRWHAKWCRLTPPIYYYIKNPFFIQNVSILEFNKQIIVFYNITDSIRDDGLRVNNFTSGIISCVDNLYKAFNRMEIVRISDIRENTMVCDALVDTNILDKHCRYLHSHMLYIVRARSHSPLLSLHTDILRDIYYYLGDKTSRRNFLASSAYLYKIIK